ncbi:MAG: ribosome maturation factor RimP [Acidimicrobiia bacterium]|nr:ribosome maturation factor RimP [Acidimicrobiia bacterium]
MSEKQGALVASFTDLVLPITDDFQCELVDVDYNNGVMKLVIDQPDGLLSQTLIEVTKAVSRMIDAEDPIPGRFTLEVTSPGVERPLKKPEHFRRSVGETVSIKTMPDVAGDRRIEGDLVSCDEFGVTVSTGDGEQTLRYGEIRSARTVFAWGPTPKRGGNKNGSSNGAKQEMKTKKGQLADER